ncbi:spermidine acetyltransferase [Ensifer sp. Root31]|uniref:GNAT family N-acetyltransferase n=1 Tax=Ensifer sp. Root31 TaxID=1736512 RepID=UPI00070B7F90|nr:GNAT family N-acetyltransferase [Ensifer sp. Root31]KQU95996.1 spermidine acetyltransferase [Ensifer sp. Root31]
MQDSNPIQVTTSIVTVERIKPEDHTCVLALQPHSHQLSYVASNAASLEEANENPACTSFVIRAHGEPVGFAMHALDEDDGNYWVYRLMIDARFQGMGYGRAALSRIIQKLAELPDCSCIVLGVKPENERARRLYENAGFQITGDGLGEHMLAPRENASNWPDP